MPATDTIEGIADLIGAPADALAATMAKYNSDVTATGKDSEFGRAHKVSQIDTPPPLDNPPYYAWKTANVLYGTSGGIKHNLDMQVVDVNGDIIEGLYLAGTICTYSNMGVVPSTIKSVGASGTGFGGSIIWGRFAAQQIKALELGA
jgi:predicted oxidoreductase